MLNRTSEGMKKKQKHAYSSCLVSSRALLTSTSHSVKNRIALPPVNARQSQPDPSPNQSWDQQSPVFCPFHAAASHSSHPTAQRAPTPASTPPTYRTSSALHYITCIWYCTVQVYTSGEREEERESYHPFKLTCHPSSCRSHPRASLPSLIRPQAHKKSEFKSSEVKTQAPTGTHPPSHHQHTAQRSTAKLPQVKQRHWTSPARSSELIAGLGPGRQRKRKGRGAGDLICDRWIRYDRDRGEWLLGERMCLHG